MAYKLLDPMDLYNILSRWHDGYKIQQISQALQMDRKTVRTYIRLAEQAGLSKRQPLPEKAALLSQLAPLIPTNQRPQPARHVLAPYRDEIVHLITNATDPLKPKTAYEVICARYSPATSYSSFKRFIHADARLVSKPRSTCRFETAAGEEVQIDYGKMGRLYNPLTQKEQTVYAFIATLSFSRLKYVEFCYRQEQKSFIAAHVRLFEFLDGVPKRAVIDNLKAGVIAPDLYDPKLNRAYQELADHYGFFSDAARVRHPQDKGKVERSVPVVREMFRKLKALHPNLDLATANHFALAWARQDNGMKVHGTTGLKPWEVYGALEKPALLPLPTLVFERAIWKEAKVHADQFIQFEKKFYSVPEPYIGKTVWVRGAEKLVAIFYQQQLIWQYPRNRQTRMFEATDFSNNVQMMMGEQAIQNLIARAQAIGPHFKELLANVLTPHAKLNYRRALALLNFNAKYSAALLEAAAPTAITNKIYVPQVFQRLLEQLQAPEDRIPISDETQALLRPADYFIHSPSPKEIVCNPMPN